MPDERLGAWIEKGFRDYVEDRMRAGEARDVAEDNAQRSQDSNFPDGKPLASHRIFDVVAEDETVGFLWIGPRLEGSDQWWIYDIEIDEKHRRRGYARAALELGHVEAKALGAAAIGLNVFAFNDGARALYESLGYEPTAIQMLLPLA
jgi:ribosomal protein S18 acetylase RimI-like enzyme